MCGVVRSTADILFCAVSQEANLNTFFLWATFTNKYIGFDIDGKEIAVSIVKNWGKLRNEMIFVG